MEAEPIVENKLVVPLKSQDFTNIIGLQFTLEWNPEAVQFDQLRGQQINLISNLDLVDQGLLTVTWNSKKEQVLSLDEQSILSTFEFTALDASIDSDIKISSGLTPALAYNSSLKTIIIKGKLNIKQELIQHDLSIYPNPAAVVLTISGNVSTKAYSIITTTGRIMWIGYLNAANQVNIERLMPGFYIFQTMGEGDAVLNRKFIKQ